VHRDTATKITNKIDYID